MMRESPGGATVLVVDTGGDPAMLADEVDFVDSDAAAPPWVLPFAGLAQLVATRAVIAMSPRIRRPRGSLDVLDVLIFW
jgi:hypothetical protein